VIQCQSQEIMIELQPLLGHSYKVDLSTPSTVHQLTEGNYYKNDEIGWEVPGSETVS